MIKDAKKFTITRSKWNYGDGKKTSLIDDDGNKDCFGFFFEACGIDSSQLVGYDEPIDIVRQYEWHSKLITQIGNAYFSNHICRHIIIANDADDMTQEQRENTLIQLFKTMDIDLTFVD